MTRPSEVTDQQIIDAGLSLQKDGQEVTGFRLRKLIGAGAAARLMRVWREFEMTHDQGKESGQTETDLPLEIEDALGQAFEQHKVFLRRTASDILRNASRLSERRVLEVTENAAKERERYREELSEAEASNQELDQVNETIAEQNSVLLEQIVIAQEATRAALSEVALHKERENNLHAKVRELEQDNEEMSGQLQQHKLQLDDCLRGAALKDERHSIVEKQLSQLQLAHDAVSDRNIERGEQLSAAKEKISGLEDRVADLLQQLEHHRVELSRAQDGSLRLARSNDSLQMLMDKIVNAQPAESTGKGGEHGEG